MNRNFWLRLRLMIALLSLCLFLSTAACFHKADPVFIPIDTNIQRIIEAKDFDSLLFLYFKSLATARLLELKLKDCEKNK